jgi:hypothetical protein
MRVVGALEVGTGLGPDGLVLVNLSGRGEATGDERCVLVTGSDCLDSIASPRHGGHPLHPARAPELRERCVQFARRLGEVAGMGETGRGVRHEKGAGAAERPHPRDWRYRRQATRPFSYLAGTSKT